MKIDHLLDIWCDRHAPPGTKRFESSKIGKDFRCRVCKSRVGDYHWQRVGVQKDDQGEGA